MTDDGIVEAVSNGTSIARMFVEPRYIRKCATAVNQSYEESKRIVDASSEPACIVGSHYFACNESYSQLLRMFGCPHSSLGMRQLDNIARIVSNVDIDESKFDQDSIDYDVLMKIFDEIRFVSDDELSRIWSNLLKDEVENTRSFSKRTVVQLSQLTADEARLFEKNRRHICRESGVFFYLSEPGMSGANLLERTTLIEAGFIGSSELIIPDGYYVWNDFCVETRGKAHLFKLTNFGIDIYRLTDGNSILDDCVDEFNSQTDLVSFSVYKEKYESSYYTELLYHSDDSMN